MPHGKLLLSAALHNLKEIWCGIFKCSKWLNWPPEVFDDLFRHSSLKQLSQAKYYFLYCRKRYTSLCGHSVNPFTVITFYISFQKVILDNMLNMEFHQRKSCMDLLVHKMLCCQVVRFFTDTFRWIYNTLWYSLIWIRQNLLLTTADAT